MTEPAAFSRSDSAAIAPQIVVAGHICLDLMPAIEAPGQFDLARFEPGRLVKVGRAAISTGGAVANTGLALHRLGVPVRLAGKVGDDLFGRAILDLLHSQSPSLADGMIVAPGESTSYSIVISPPGVDRMFLHCPGANDRFAAADVTDALLAGARLFHFGYPPIMRSMYAENGAQLRRLFSHVRAAGVATSLDMAMPDPASEAGRVDWPRLLAGVLPGVDIFLPSIDELLFMLNRPAFENLAASPSGNFLTLALLRQTASRLLDMGTAVAAIKLGDQGLYVQTTSDSVRLQDFCDLLGLDIEAWRGREIFSPCFKTSVIGTTGSGDCTIAGFLAALLRGEGPMNAATAATAVGACSVEAVDATSGIASWATVVDRLHRGWPRRPIKIDLKDSPNHAQADAHGTLQWSASARRTVL